MIRILFFLSGLGWALYSFYDWIIMEHQINTGYPIKSIPDFLNFILPLLALFGLKMSYLSLKVKQSKLLHIGINTLSVGLILISLGLFGGNWIFHAPIPIYMMLFFIGSILSTIGLFMSISLSNNIAARLNIIFIALCTLAYPILPQLLVSSTGTLIATNIKGYLGIALGLLWILLGLSLNTKKLNKENYKYSTRV